MNTAARLSLYGLGLVAVFGVAAALSGALAPEGIATEWTTSQKETDMQQHSTAGAHADVTDDPGHGGHASAGTAHLGGLTISDGGYTLDAIAAPASTGEQGVLTFRIVDEHGRAVTSYETEHDKELHLIVVRTDGTQFRHVHPERDADGVWSIAWSWDAAGSYRVYADFTASGSDAVTLSRIVQVAGDHARSTRSRRASRRPTGTRPR